MLATIIINCLLICAAVLIHYEILSILTTWLTKAKQIARLRLVLAVFGSLCAHTIEIWVYAFAYYFMEKTSKIGVLMGNFSDSILDCAYFSFTSYTSVGYGDIYPTGNIRFIAGLEALTGLVLISWTASFLYFEMQKIWGHPK